MIYPTGEKNKKDFFNKWYSAQSFGNKTNYGYHDGEDINKKTGGNTDLGEPLYAICAGEVTSVHSHATGFGNHIHIKHDIGRRTYYSHYAHCGDIVVSRGDVVSEGQKIAHLGSSGNSKYAHLHFAIKNQPTGIDGIARTLTDLKKWESPFDFIQNDIITPNPQTEEPMINDDTVIELDKPFNKMTVRDIKSNLNDMKGELDKLKNVEAEYKQLKEIHEKIKQELTDEIKKAREESKRFEEKYKLLLSGVAGRIGTKQQEEVIYPELDLLVKKADKVDSIQDNRTLSPNVIQTFIKAMKVLFNRLDDSVKN
jgi:hypothetical protein